MNEQIGELWIQAAEQARQEEPTDLLAARVIQVEEFAELLIRETITEMCQQLHWAGDDQSNNPAFYKAIDKTLRHFGVKKE